jgi:hypothetical protein
MTLNLKNKIALISAISAALPAVIMILMLIIQKSSLSGDIISEVDKLAKINLNQNAQAVYSQCEIANEMINAQLKQNLYIGDDLIRRKGGIHSSGENIQWSAINQETKSVSELSLPKMKIGGEWFEPTKEAKKSVVFVDEIAKQGASTCTIFQRMNEKGDMLRIATTVINEKGNRAIGTYIPAVGKDGSSNKVLSAVLKGQTYFGSAFVVNKYYQTVYQPIRDASGKIIGMFYVGVTPESLVKLRESIMNIKIGKTGYIYVLNGKGIKKGHYVISKDGKRDGEDIWESKDADGKYFIQSIIKNGLELNNNSVHYEFYPWKNKGEDKARMKIAAIMYYEPFDWIIGAGAYEDEFREAGAVVKSGINKLLIYISLIGIILLAIVIFAAFYLSSKISNPIVTVTNAMKQIANGNLKDARKILE